MIYDKKETLLDYMGAVCELFICESSKVAEKAEQAELELKNLLDDLKAEGILRLQVEIGIGWQNLAERLENLNWRKLFLSVLMKRFLCLKLRLKKIKKV